LVGTVEQLEKDRDEIKEREEQIQEGLACAGREYEELWEELRGGGVNQELD
jgi:hypothetical protein